MARGVRNLRGIGGVKPIQGHIFIPPKFNPVVKVELITSSNTYDITEAIEESSWTDSATEGIGNFEIRIIDPSKVYSDNVSAYDSIKIYIDYGTSATTLRFKGRIERSGREDYAFVISGRSEGIIIMGKNINYSATNKKKSDVLKEIIASEFTELTVTNVEENTDLVNVDYSEIPFIEIVNEMIGSTHAFYIDANADTHYFLKGSRQNITEAVVEGMNHISTNEYTSDSEQTVTKVRVYGQEADGLPLIATSTSSTSLTGGIVKEEIIRDQSLTTFTQAQERADREYAANQVIPNVGSITSLMLPTIQPGEQIKMFIPMDKIDPTFYNIQGYTHTYPKFQTQLNIQQKRLNVSRVISKNIAAQSKLMGENNSNDMDYSVIYTFFEDSGTHDNTVIDTAAKTLSTNGSATGTWISPQVDSHNGKEISLLEIRVNGVNFNGINVFVSLNGGLTFTSAHLLDGELTNVDPGTSIIIKVFVPSADTIINSIGVYYKT